MGLPSGGDVGKLFSGLLTHWKLQQSEHALQRQGNNQSNEKLLDCCDAEVSQRIQLAVLAETGLQPPGPHLHDLM